jgi:3-phenylpropionate/trans-cinnamate dioxygenase ferredoxin subunit
VAEPNFQRLCAAAELAEGAMRRVLVGARELVLCRTREGVYALDNICTHGLARLDEGRLRGVRLICPLHGASFDCRSGRVLGAPATVPLARHEVRIIDGFVEVALAP